MDRDLQTPPLTLPQADVAQDLIEGHKPLAQLRRLGQEHGVLGLDCHQVLVHEADRQEDLAVGRHELGQPGG